MADRGARLIRRKRTEWRPIESPTDEGPFCVVDEAALIHQLSGQSSDHRQRCGDWFRRAPGDKTDACQEAADEGGRFQRNRRLTYAVLYGPLIKVLIYKEYHRFCFLDRAQISFLIPKG